MIYESTTASIYFESHGDNGDWVTLVNGHTRTIRDFKMFSKKLVQNGFRVLLTSSPPSEIRLVVIPDSYEVPLVTITSTATATGSTT